MLLTVIHTNLQEQLIMVGVIVILAAISGVIVRGAMKTIDFSERDKKSTH
jgi:hypothetical protein